MNRLNSQMSKYESGPPPQYCTLCSRPRLSSRLIQKFSLFALLLCNAEISHFMTVLWKARIVTTTANLQKVMCIQWNYNYQECSYYSTYYVFRVCKPHRDPFGVDNYKNRQTLSNLPVGLPSV
jgi:hypothetical protein